MSLTEERKISLYEEGRAARAQGAILGDTPYHPEFCPDEFKVWEAGFLEEHERLLREFDKTNGPRIGYLPIEALKGIAKRYGEAHRCKCGKPAEYLTWSVSSAGHLDWYWATAACGACMEKTRKRNNRRIMPDWESVKRYADAFLHIKRKENIATPAYYANRKKEAFKRHGKIHVASGYKGMAYELPDGSFVCEMRDGSKIIPCCWQNIGHILDRRHRNMTERGCMGKCGSESKHAERRPGDKP